MDQYMAAMLCALSLLSAIAPKNPHVFEDAVSQFREGNVSAAKAEINRLPDEQIIRQGIEYYEKENPADPGVQRFVIQTLVEHYAAKMPEGFDFLQNHVNDNSAQDLVWAGLLAVDEERRGDAASVIGQALVQAPRPKNTGEVLSALASWKGGAKGALAGIATVFEDRNESPRIRSLAAQAMLQIGPVSRAMQHFRPEDRGIVLGPLGYVGGTTAGRFDADQDERAKAREYVREALDDPDRETRELAFQVLPYVFGEDFVVGDPSGGFRINPEFEAIVRQVANHDPEESLREHAQGVLNTLDRRLEKAIRMRENGVGKNAPQSGK